MILLTYPQPINGRVYTNEMIDVDTFVKHFKIPMPQGVKAVIERTQVRPDPSNPGMFQFAKKRLIPSVFTATFNGSSVTVRYAESTTDTVVSGSVVKKYFPEKITHEGIEVAYALPDKKEEAAYIIASPYCEDSPFPNPRAEKQFRLKLGAMKAEKTINLRVVKAEVEKAILAESDAQKLRVFAYGLKIPRVPVNVDPEATLPEIQEYLCGLLDGYTESFVANWRDNRSLTDIKGTLRMLFEGGEIETKSGGAGTTIWKYRYDIENGAQIMIAQNGEDVMESLLGWALKNDNFRTLVLNTNNYRGQVNDQFVAGVVTSNIEALEAIPFDQMTVPQLFQYSLQQDKIDYDRTEGKIYFVQQDGSRGPVVLMKNVGDPKTWKDTVLDRLAKNPIELNKLKRFLKTGVAPTFDKKSENDDVSVQQ